MGLELGNAQHERSFGGPALVPVEKWPVGIARMAPCARATMANRIYLLWPERSLARAFSRRSLSKS